MNIGNKIIVTNNGETYSTYKGMAIQLLNMNKWVPGKTPVNGSEGTIVNISYKEDIYGIEIEGQQYLIGFNGIDLLSRIDEESKKLPNELHKKVLFPLEYLDIYGGVGEDG